MPQSRSIGASDVPPIRSSTQHLGSQEQHRKVYRLKGIPLQWDSQRLETQLHTRAEIQDGTTINVRSLALDIGRPGELQMQTAVVSFSYAPQWPCQDRTSFVVGNTRLNCDTIFDGFTPLSSVHGTQPAIDCIVLPGWGGHPMGSFMAQESPHIWLIDRLARHFPNFRVWTYGYGAPLRNQLPREDVYEFAQEFISRFRRMRSVFGGVEQKSPIVVLAHSLGGLLFKEIMIKLSQSSHSIDQINVNCTYGALFFGVPSAGMDVEAIAEMVGHLPARTTLNDLDRRIGHRLRDRQHNLFCDSFGYRDSVIVRFYEMLPTPTVIPDANTQNGFSRAGPPRLLVDYQSATVGRGWETDEENIIGLYGNHTTMVKLPEDFDEDYEKIYEVLRRFSATAPTVILSRFNHSSNQAIPNLNQSPSTGPEDIRDAIRRQDQVLLQRAAERESAEHRRVRIACQDSLSFSKMSSRQQRVRANLERTCTWALRHESFTLWLEPRREFHKPALLWIKGKAGSGKSTLMKYLIHKIRELHDLNHQAKSSNPTAYLATFFFDARGNELEKSPLGMFRTLLRELLEQEPRLMEDFMGLYESKKARNDPEWHLEELREWVQEKFIKYGDKPVYIFIDALDECEETDMEAHTNARDLVNFFEDLLQTRTSGEGILEEPRTRSLHLCLSSRHYPYISVQRNIDLLEVHMEHENSADIRQYIRMKLPLDRDAMPSYRFTAKDYLGEVGEEVARRAKGVFLWVVLVVNDLKLAQDRGKSMREIRGILDRIPDALNDLFDQILEAVTQRDRSDTFQLLQFVIFAHRGVDATAAQHALAFRAEPPPVSVEQWRKSDEFLGPKKFRRWVEDTSRGLIEVVPTDREHTQSALQFIHETVRVFFLDQGCRRLLTLHSSPIANPISMIHHHFVKTCFNYLAAEDVRATVAMRTRERPAFGDYESLVKGLVETFPFLAYATCEMQRHAVEADGQSNGPSHLWMLQKFAKDERGVFTTWQNLQKLPPTRSISHLDAFNKWKDYSHKISGLEYAAMCEIPAPLSTILDFQKFGDAEVISALSHIAQTGNATAARSLVESMPSRLVPQAARIALQYTKDIDIARTLLKFGPDLHVRNELGETELHRRHDEPDFTRLLLHADADANAQTLMKSTALHLTTNPEVTRLLVGHGANPSIRNLLGLTALEMLAGMQLHPEDDAMKLRLQEKERILKEASPFRS